MGRPANTFTGWVSTLAHEHTRGLLHIARSEGLTPEEALDAVQDGFYGFLRLPQARNLVGVPEDSRALIGVIVRNSARNLRRRHHRARPHAPLDEVHSAADTGPSVDDLISQAEQHVQLQGCVDRLAELQRKVVTLRMLEEASGAEVAAQLEIESGHVAVLLHRAKKDLLLCMRDGVSPSASA